MLSRLHRIAAPCAALALSACAGGDSAAERDLAILRTEIEQLRRQGDALSRGLDSLGARLDRLEAKPPAPRERADGSGPAAPIVPPDLAVVRVAPPREPEPREADEEGGGNIVFAAPSRPRTPRAAPRLPTAVPVAEPEAARLEELSAPAGRGLAAEAEGELAAARRKEGVARARALEAFVARYPRHPSADNALVEAARAYAGSGRDDAGCALARRVPDEYPAGDAVAGAMEIASSCERSRP